MLGWFKKKFSRKTTEDTPVTEELEDQDSQQDSGEQDVDPDLSPEGDVALDDFEALSAEQDISEENQAETDIEAELERPEERDGEESVEDEPPFPDNIVESDNVHEVAASPSESEQEESLEQVAKDPEQEAEDPSFVEPAVEEFVDEVEPAESFTDIVDKVPSPEQAPFVVDHEVTEETEEDDNADEEDEVEAPPIEDQTEDKQDESGVIDAVDQKSFEAVDESCNEEFPDPTETEEVAARLNEVLSVDNSSEENEESPQEAITEITLDELIQDEEAEQSPSEASMEQNDYSTEEWGTVCPADEVLQLDDPPSGDEFISDSDSELEIEDIFSDDEISVSEVDEASLEDVVDLGNSYIEEVDVEVSGESIEEEQDFSHVQQQDSFFDHTEKEQISAEKPGEFEEFQEEIDTKESVDVTDITMDDLLPEPETSSDAVLTAKDETAGDEETADSEDDDPEVTPKPQVEQEKPQISSMFKRLQERLGKTRNNFVHRLDTLFRGKKEIDLELLDDLEEILITADLGVQTAQDLLDEARKSVKRNELSDPKALKDVLRNKILAYLQESDQPAELVLPESGPFVIMVVGVNGVGKTTTIGKIASKFVRAEQSVLLVAGDTFRAAAIDQLKIWGDRVGVDVVSGNPGADPSSVVFDGVARGVSKDYDVVIIDTAGRLHTSVNLMEELKKIKRVIGKNLETAPHEVMLVLDATTGQNAISQAKFFHEAVTITGLTVTKLDGTAKGGIVANVCRELKIPVRFIGIGEQVDDLRDFDSQEFVEALFSRDDSNTDT